MGLSLVPPQPSDVSPPKTTVADAGHREDRDPHKLPVFDVKSMEAPTTSTLYLPPLLSSLPHALPPIETHDPKLATETRLPDIDPVSLSLHKALHKFRPIHSDYSLVTYADAFNWNELELPEDEEREWYCVAFRSKRKAGSDSTPLYEADKKAHEEAISNGGLILYWYGVPHAETGMNLATCIWQSRKHARAANSRPHHIRAMRLAANSYEVYQLERYKLTKAKGTRHLAVEPFDGEEVGW
ncbi:hypothetical protein CONPUDRAFT_101544 [Coniophora puteana RWD-64-598 SS2]|uniref:Uncharacterized protein n=1 Tax=Coniophora puteana (strain RWD-64-598) TaxID=741705 RepID=A0A5M3MV77_CONPW|nr:uncharacterized protein CONPUDRAFT_101544 [Coniophora puteana RWD-64-598 SS2]EIW83026.1 hypothetical protein CONPUDRAFT_101544 [Coniophora puteana RWD-64-598 SS2]